MTNSLPFTVTNAVTAPSPVLNGVQGYNPTTGAYTNNTALASTYLVLYGTFGSSGNGVLIDGSAVSASAVTYQSATQINVSLAGIATGSHTVAVLTTTGTTGSLPFTVTASGGGEPDGGRSPIHERNFAVLKPDAAINPLLLRSTK
ncbi:MAG: hypothetical protein ABSC29_02730 [Minisyncoccia bacterium]